ncbi:MAG TPA: hypothetical protein VFV14_06410 [Myxococcaceae bacterium]|nr:hypothetical protein [Myxococcaceae bacterium]
MDRAASVIFALLVPVAASAKGNPAYVPRAALVGTFFNTVVTPQLRLTWELTLVEREKNALLLVLEGGGGYGVLLPTNLGPTGMLSMTRLYQLTALAGIAFHADYEDSRWHWGGQLATGPLFYGAKFSDGFTEDKVWPMLEARARVGLRFGATVYGLAFGWAFTYPGLTTSLTTPYLGGPMVGIFADRR